MTEEKKAKFFRSHGMCAVCGKPIERPQFAHRIANTTTNRKKWGSFIIDHPENGEFVCSLRCNDILNIGYRKGDCLRLIKRIIDTELEKMEEV